MTSPKEKGRAGIITVNESRWLDPKEKEEEFGERREAIKRRRRRRRRCKGVFVFVFVFLSEEGR
jgi:hypothetical protein